MENVLYLDRNLIQHLSRLFVVSAVLFAAAGCGADNEASVLFQLDQKPFLAQLDAARGELKQQEARSWTGRASYKRKKPLAAENAVSQCNFKT